MLCPAKAEFQAGYKLSTTLDFHLLPEQRAGAEATPGQRSRVWAGERQEQGEQNGGKGLLQPTKGLSSGGQGQQRNVGLPEQ